ncbi:hypothetical protein [Streptomyces formicae]
MAESMVARRDAELDDLWRLAQAQYVGADDPDIKLKAINTLRGLNESRRKLNGADAPEALKVVLEAASARLRAIEGGEFTPPDPLPPLGVAPTSYTGEGGALFIDGPDGLRYRAVEPQAAPVVTQPALPPGPSARRPDDADDILSRARASLDEEDDDEEP